MRAYRGVTVPCGLSKVYHSCVRGAVVKQYIEALLASQFGKPGLGTEQPARAISTFTRWAISSRTCAGILYIGIVGAVDAVVRASSC